MTMVVFAGPTVPLKACRRVLDATYLPPVSQGDVYRVAIQAPRAIGIVDGFFERVPAVWHKEILWAMARGIHVFGAASMGALRAAELAPFGMVGVGAIFEAYRDGRLEDDDEVAIVHSDADSGYAAISTAMVDIRATLAAAAAAGVIDAVTHQRLIAIGKSLFYPDRSYQRLVQEARTREAPPAQIDALERWLPANRISQKREDALAMLRRMAEWQAMPPAPLEVKYHFEHTDVWEQVVNRNGRQMAAGLHRAPEQALLEELRLDRDAYERASDGALARTLALAEAEGQDVQPDAALIEQAVTGLRRTHALVEADALARWIELQDLDMPGFGEFIAREARIGWVRTMHGAEVARHLPDWLRAAGRYRKIAERAREKRHWLAAHGLENASLANARLDEITLLRWFFEERRGEPVPARLDLHAHAIGFRNRAAFVQAVLREYYFATRPGATALDPS